MKTSRHPYHPSLLKRSDFRSGFAVLSLTVAALLGLLSLMAQEVKQAAEPLETNMDLPSEFHRFYGQRINQWRDTERRVAKLDVDGDLNYDGTIDNEDPADNGAFESTPPGLVIGKGEVSKLLVRVNPYRVDFKGEVVITLEVAGINRAVRSGRFASLNEELAVTGRIRVWRDAERTELLLDSGDPNKRYYEWVVDDQVWPPNLPGVYPRIVYVEGVGSSPRYLGDLRLLATVSHRPKGADRANYPEHRKRLLTAYRTSFDHLLFTVRDQPQPKEYINNNAEGVWSTVSGSAAPAGE